MKRVLNPITALMAAALLLGGCGQTSPPAPRQADSEPQQQATSPQQAPPPPPPPRKYTWGLPVGDVSPNFNERDVYNRLRDGDCAGAQNDLDEYQAWQGFSSPRNVLLAQAAIEFCSGDAIKGTQLFKRAESMGWSGLLRGDGKAHASCEFYKSGASLIQQRPRTDFSCPAGDPPPWKEAEQEKHQDPR